MLQLQRSQCARLLCQWRLIDVSEIARGGGSVNGLPPLALLASATSPPMADKNPERITPRGEDYSRWYQDVIRQAGLAEPAEVVKGCMVIKPHGYAIWEI